ncbi:MAG: PKD domain-containing protein [Myxococcota bacterium]
MKRAYILIIIFLLSFACSDTTTQNRVPVAFAGFDRTVIVSLSQEEVELDGTGSYDPDSDILNYRWRVESVPDNSKVATSNINNYDRPIASFIPDVAGDYVFSLTVDDGIFSSQKDIVVITVISR